MKNYEKYQKNYFVPPKGNSDWVNKENITTAPMWCSVDLRDGNQALITPMSLDEKVEFFNLLVKVGFKEIEVGFPAASETEYEFCRKLIEENLIPDDVKIQVLTQAREHIIEKTFKALEGAKNAVVHFYNSTSKVQREQVFKKSKDEIKKIAVDGAELVLKYAKQTKGNFTFEYSPESFSNTEPEFALEVINAVVAVLKPTAKNKCIVNLPDTVQLSQPHIYANQVEYICKNIKNRENVIISLHPHNDRGCGIAAAELGMLAGADRIEGTLFGNGERTGNVDIITLALNLYMHGVNPNLDFSDMYSLINVYEKVTGLSINPRQPYSGELVFTAFSGSHQDAIAKGLEYHKEHNITKWQVPYLPIDPKCIGRSYDKDVIRINSQSGKGGIGYLLNKKFGFNLPAKMREEFGYLVKDSSDKAHKELNADEIHNIFKDNYVNIEYPLEFVDYATKKIDGNTKVELEFIFKRKRQKATGVGNGILDAVANIVRETLKIDFNDITYFQHALESGSKARAVCYIGLYNANTDKHAWGVGIDSDTSNASLRALASAINKTV